MGDMLGETIGDSTMLVCDKGVSDMSLYCDEDNASSEHPVASGVSSGVASGVAIGVAIGVACRAACGVACGVASRVACGVASGVACGDASGVEVSANVVDTLGDITGVTLQ